MSGSRILALGTALLALAAPATAAAASTTNVVGIPLTMNTAATALASTGCGGHYDDQNPPATIRVLLSSGGISTVPFEQYVKDVLPNEWISRWQPAALQAGAMAVKTYAWYWTNHSGARSSGGQCFDVYDTTQSQVYKAGSHKPSTDAAVDATWGVSMRRDGAIFEAQYRATAGGTGCGQGADGIKLSQNGSQACAVAGYDYQRILRTYYSNIDISAGGGTTRSPFSEGRGILYYPQADGRMLWYDHTGYLSGTQDWTGNSGAQVSQGWNEYGKVFSGGNGIVYGISPNGDLHWYKNTGYLSGTADWTANSGAVVSHGWNEYSRVFSLGDGIIYGVASDGTLHWYHHTGYLTGTADWTSNSGVQVSQGWDQFSLVVGGADGVIYAVTSDGRLLWYDHTGYKSGTSDWTGNSGAQVSQGWTEFTHVFSGGNGILYGVSPNGDLHWYDHLGYHTGSAAWSGNSSALVSHGWNN
ncbi:tachylectin-related carbohydrate-binding protein [Kutzneria sp. 744]|uniref:tachylectin-related carbohydrate-binding protein n=1 Tax=Kutzneria sp. (strain 744) TaxID=345341 RepID=UPI0003EEB1F7|nr:tachylectin-related carbohydrate-binding protein [Kutzneria sp. 744]EWM18307.1 glycoprotein X [Kutzneria sp. 744]